LEHPERLEAPDKIRDEQFGIDVIAAGLKVAAIAYLPCL